MYRRTGIVSMIALTVFLCSGAAAPASCNPQDTRIGPSGGEVVAAASTGRLPHSAALREAVRRRRAAITFSRPPRSAITQPTTTRLQITMSPLP